MQPRWQPWKERVTDLSGGVLVACTRSKVVWTDGIRSRHSRLARGRPRGSLAAWNGGQRSAAVRSTCTRFRRTFRGERYPTPEATNVGGDMIRQLKDELVGRKA